MRLISKASIASCLALSLMICPVSGQQTVRSGDVPIDTARSVVTVRVSRAGVFKFAGDDHEIQAPISAGVINANNPAVEIRIETASLTVRDPNLPPEKRSEVQQKMLSSEVLDAQRYPTIHFRSAQVTPNGTDRWLVRGDLTLHGETRPVSFDVVRTAAGQYRGVVPLKQTDYGITPVKIAGGTVKVKNEVKIEFAIVPR